MNRYSYIHIRNNDLDLPKIINKGVLNMGDKEFTCSENCIHYNKVKEVKKYEPTQSNLMDISEMFKLFADNTRLRIVCAILKEELCVCDLCELLGLTQSNVSHQLQLLRAFKLVKYRKEGKQVYYSLEDEHIERIIQMAVEHIKEEQDGKKE